jgi:hypothetical protein
MKRLAVLLSLSLLAFTRLGFNAQAVIATGGIEVNAGMFGPSHTYASIQTLIAGSPAGTRFKFDCGDYITGCQSGIRRKNALYAAQQGLTAMSQYVKQPSAITWKSGNTGLDFDLVSGAQTIDSLHKWHASQQNTLIYNCGASSRWVMTPVIPDRTSSRNSRPRAIRRLLACWCNRLKPTA